jgi:hypothetical protein
MRIANLRQHVLGVLGSLAAAGVCSAQAANPAVNISSVVRGGVVVVSYDLVSSDPAAQFSVALDVSADGGRTFALRPKTLKGDVGAAVRTGAGKQITWEAARDVENLDVDRYRYRVTAVRSLAATASGSQIPAQSPGPAVQPRGNGLRWAGIGLLGGGGALMFLGMRKQTHCDFVDCWEEHGQKGLLWAGVGAAAGGGALLAAGAARNNATEVVIRPAGVAIQRHLQLPWPAR